jgi:hypothetical protein
MYGLGVDLGTSFTAAAVAANGTLDMVGLSGAAVVTPSAAYLDKNGKLLTGEAADRLGMRDPSRAAWEFKRRIGDPTPVLLAGLPYSPATLMAAQLRSILDTVSEAQGEPADHIVLTHPAVWGAYRQEQFAAIPRLAGLPGPERDGRAAPSGPVVLTTTEPVAAATYYCTTRPLPPNGLLAVYDLGGGTFDSAVVRNARSGLEIVGTPEGIEWLGGADFDRAVLDHVDRELNGAISALDPADPSTATILATLHRECIVAKEALSTRAQAQMTVALPDGRRNVVLSRDTFEEMITPSLDATIEAFRRTLANTGITPQDLTAVLLVGGSSEIPRVTELLRDTLRRPILINTHPKHAVSLGAAKLGADALAQMEKRAGRRSGRRMLGTSTATSTSMDASSSTTSARQNDATAAPQQEATPAPQKAPSAVPQHETPAISQKIPTPEPAKPTKAAPTPKAAPAQAPAPDAGPPAGQKPEVEKPETASTLRPPTGPPSEGGLTAVVPPRRRWRPKRAVLTIIVPILVLVGATFLLAPRLSTGDTPCGTANVALQRPASASATEGAAYTAANAVDGKPDTRWGSAFDDPQWLQVDLGESMDVCGATIKWETAYAAAFRIELSADGTSWKGVYQTTTGSGGAQHIEFSSRGRYLRLYCTARSTTFGYSIWELEVFAAGRMASTANSAALVATATTTRR